MYTASEALELVKGRKAPENLVGFDFPEIDKCILQHIKDGWLCANIRHLLPNASSIYHVGKYLQKLGYKLDRDGLVYWHL